MEYEVEREPGQFHIREKGQLTRGTTVTDVWLEQMGFGRLTRLNIDAVVQAAAASAFGVILDPDAARRLPKDIPFTAGFKSFPHSPTRGRLPRNPERMHIPDRILKK